MRKLLFWSVVLSLLVTLPMIAGGPTGPAGKSNVGHLSLFEKTGHPDWQIVEGGAWGKMTYNLSGPEFEFVFNGHGLEAGVEYCLIYYPDPWPGTGLICLGTATANGGGNVHIAASVDTGDLPAAADANFEKGAKIWLVLATDVDCETGVMSVWNPTEWLFEYDLITFDDTDA